MPVVFLPIVLKKKRTKKRMKRTKTRKTKETMVRTEVTHSLFLERLFERRMKKEESI